MLNIRPATDADRDLVWLIFHETIAAGDTYALDPLMLRADALAYWFAPATQTYVAEQVRQSDGLVPRRDRQSVGEAVGFPGTATPSPTAVAQDRHLVGTYILRPNQRGGGAHVANAAFMVASTARGQGVGGAMAEHCLSEARRLGFWAMQFNFVVSTNESAIHLWKQLGFEIVGTLPKAFLHPQHGFVDVYVMFRSLL
jgi:L-amino acid N-acyltransferase YncA